MATTNVGVAPLNAPSMTAAVDPYRWDTLRLRDGVTPEMLAAMEAYNRLQGGDMGPGEGQLDMSSPTNFRSYLANSGDGIWGGSGSVTRNPDGTYNVWRHTADGSGKYDMVSASYKLNPDGSMTRVSDWVDADRQKSSKDYVDLAKFAALAAAGGLGVNALAGLTGGAAGGGAAATGGGAAGGGATGAGVSAAEAFRAFELGQMGSAAGAAGSAVVPSGVTLANAGGVMSTAAPAATAASGGGGLTGALSSAGKFLADNPTLAKLGLTLAAGALSSGGGSDVDTGAITATAGQSASLGQDALNWFKSIYAEQAPARTAAAQRANAISDAQLEAMRFATDEAKDLSAYNKTTFRPVEQRIASDAMTWDSPARMAQAAADATADVRAAMATQQGALTRSLNRAGIAPGSGRMLAMANDLALAGAKAEGGAATTARRMVQDQGQQMRLGAASIGRGIPVQQAQQQQLATGSGNASLGSSQAALDATQSGANQVATGYGLGMQGLNAAGNLYSQASRLKAGQGTDDLASMAAFMQGLGSLNLFGGK